jgi:uncharacterized Zn finger protein (UPF0148 family)
MKKFDDDSCDIFYCSLCNAPSFDLIHYQGRNVCPKCLKKLNDIQRRNEHHKREIEVPKDDSLY